MIGWKTFNRNTKRHIKLYSNFLLQGCLGIIAFGMDSLGLAAMQDVVHVLRHMMKNPA